MDTSDSNVLTPEELENGLLHETLNRESLEKLISSNVHENENIDTLLNFFLNYLPGKRSISIFLNRGETKFLCRTFVSFHRKQTISYCFRLFQLVNTIVLVSVVSYGMRM